LIKPVEGYLNREAQLCIIPDGSLNFLPFAALVSQSGKYLIEDFTLETSPSATSFILSSDQASLRKLNGAERLLVVGNPYFDRQQFNLPDLPAAQREAVKIAEIYGARPILGAEALAPRVKSLLRNANVAHFATHALPDQASPLLSRLVLSRGSAVDAHHASPGFLQASEIYALKLPHARLVVLSACQTGIERAYRGEGAIGLARPFIAAGVPLVVASLWPVESEGAADLMVSFHKHRKQDHVSTVEALRRAQLEYLHNEWPNSRRDFGWAAFVTIGGYAAF
jgi:CHAT domain-containing protein